MVIKGYQSPKMTKDCHKSTTKAWLSVTSLLKLHYPLDLNIYIVTSHRREDFHSIKNFGLLLTQSYWMNSEHTLLFKSLRSVRSFFNEKSPFTFIKCNIAVWTFWKTSYLQYELEHYEDYSINTRTFSSCPTDLIWSCSLSAIIMRTDKWTPIGPHPSKSVSTPPPSLLRGATIKHPTNPCT